MVVVGGPWRTTVASRICCLTSEYVRWSATSRSSPASFVASRGLAIHPSVYYGSSHATEAIQVADLFAGVRRRVLEGDVSLVPLAERLDQTRTVRGSLVLQTIKGRPYQPKILLF